MELLVAHGTDPCTLDRLGHMADECARLGVNCWLIGDQLAKSLTVVTPYGIKCLCVRACVRCFAFFVLCAV